jgi:hypothetical protein
MKASNIGLLLLLVSFVVVTLIAVHALIRHFQVGL